MHGFIGRHKSLALVHSVNGTHEHTPTGQQCWLMAEKKEKKNFPKLSS